MNDIDGQIAETVSETVSVLPVRTIVVAFAAGVVATAATSGATYLVRRYIKTRKLVQNLTTSDDVIAGEIA